MTKISCNALGSNICYISKYKKWFFNGEAPTIPLNHKLEVRFTLPQCHGWILYGRKFLIVKCEIIGVNG